MKKLPNGKYSFACKKYTHNYDNLLKKNQLQPFCAYVMYSQLQHELLHESFQCPTEKWCSVIKRTT